LVGFIPHSISAKIDPLPVHQNVIKAIFPRTPWTRGGAAATGMEFHPPSGSFELTF